MDECKFNVEAWHEEWLNSYERMATDYFKAFQDRAGRSGPLSMSDAMLVTCSPDAGDDDMDMILYDCMGSFKLPKGSAGLVSYMARFSRSDLPPPDEAFGPFESSEFPEATFLLSSLLEAAFPKNTRTGVFRGHNGGILLGYETYDEAREDLGNDAALACAFSGLGVMLMNACRPLIDPSAPDSEVIQKGENIYLCILGDEPDGEESEDDEGWEEGE